MQPKTDGIRFAGPPPCCTGTAGHTHAGKGSMPHHGSASLALGATTNSHCSEKSLLQLHIQDTACCQVPGPGNAAEVANTTTGKETTEQMLSAAGAVGHSAQMDRA